MNGEVPGFFGKVSSLGDFVTRRLPPSLTGIWDAWLQAGMQASREQLGAGWLEIYLTSPIWRFALAPGVCDQQAWTGVLIPSVDRVGRYFPLMIAASAADGAAIPLWIAQAKDWYDQVETLALSSLQADFVLDQFDAQLRALAPLPLPAQAAAQNGAAGQRIALTSLDALPEALPQVAAAALHGQSLWWTDGSSLVEPTLLACRGLPAPASFAGMLAGNWQQTGWG